MDEDTNPTPQDTIVDDSAQSGDGEPVLASPRMFDISSDLDISPADDTASEEPKPTAIIPSTQKPQVAQVVQSRYGVRPTDIKSVPAPTGRIDLSGDALKARIAAINATSPNWKPVLKVPQAPQPAPVQMPPAPEIQKHPTSVLESALLRVMPRQDQKTALPPKAIPVKQDEPKSSVGYIPLPPKPPETADANGHRKINLMEEDVVPAPVPVPIPPIETLIPQPVPTPISVPVPAAVIETTIPQPISSPTAPEGTVTLPNLVPAPQPIPITPVETLIPQLVPAPPQDVSNMPPKVSAPSIGFVTPVHIQENMTRSPEISEKNRPIVLSSTGSEVSPTQAKDASGQKVLRTYEGDVAEAMSHQMSSIASIALAENRKKGQDKIGDSEPVAKKSSVSGKNFLLILFSIILIGGGGMGAYYLYSISPLALDVSHAPVSQPQAPSGIVAADTQATISVDGRTSNAILSEIQSEVGKSQAPDTIKEIVPIQSSGTGYSRVTGPDMMNLMGLQVPDILSRSITAPWMLGVYTDAQGNRSVFVIATTDFFQDSFAGMLQWESVMTDDLKQYLYPVNVPDIANVMNPAPQVQVSNPLTSIKSTLPGATSTTVTNRANPSSKTGAQKTASTSLASRQQNLNAKPPSIESLTAVATDTDQTSQLTQNYFTIQGQFRDRILMNKDIREFVTSDGKVLFLYSFIDTTHLVVSGSESALAEIVTRLEKQAFVR